MTTRIIDVPGTSRQLASARDKLSMLSGVVAAEFVPGRNAIRVFCGDEMTQSMLDNAIGTS